MSELPPLLNDQASVFINGIYQPSTGVWRVMTRPSRAILYAPFQLARHLLEWPEGAKLEVLCRHAGRYDFYDPALVILFIERTQARRAWLRHPVSVLWPGDQARILAYAEIGGFLTWVFGRPNQDGQP